MSSYIREIKEEKFWQHIYQKTSRTNIPFNVYFELTYDCNLSCKHCYISKKGRKKELSYKETSSILDQLAVLGCFNLTLTGGEIFTRPDILKILEHAKNKGFSLTLLTSATLITPKIADYLKEIGIYGVIVSLYGITKQTYESVTDVSGSFQECLRGINLLQNRNIHISINTMVMNLNVSEFQGIKNFAEKLKAPFQYDYFIHPKIDGSKEPLSFRLSPKEVVEFKIEKGIFPLKKKKRHKRRGKHPFSKYSVFQCDGGKNFFAITPYGQMNLCIQYPFPQYDLREGSIELGWKKMSDYIKSLKPGRNHLCINCELVEFCQWCPAEGWLNKGNADSCIPYFKELATLHKIYSQKNGISKNK